MDMQTIVNDWRENAERHEDRIHLKRGTIRVGTDDPDGLAEFLNERVSLMR